MQSRRSRSNRHHPLAITCSCRPHCSYFPLSAATACFSFPSCLCWIDPPPYRCSTVAEGDVISQCTMGKSQTDGRTLSDPKLTKVETVVHFCRQGCVSADRQLHFTLSFPKLHFLKQGFCSAGFSAAVHHQCNVWRMSAATHSFPPNPRVQGSNPLTTFPFSPLVSFTDGHPSADQLFLQSLSNCPVWTQKQSIISNGSCMKTLLNKSQLPNFYEIWDLMYKLRQELYTVSCAIKDMACNFWIFTQSNVIAWMATTLSMQLRAIQGNLCKGQNLKTNK